MKNEDIKIGCFLNSCRRGPKAEGLNSVSGLDEKERVKDERIVRKIGKNRRRRVNESFPKEGIFFFISENNRDSGGKVERKPEISV